MRKIPFILSFLFCLVLAASASADQALQKLSGEWKATGEYQLEPGGEMQKTEAFGTGRRVGEQWLTFEMKGEHFGTPFTGLLTLGYDAEASSYKATWIDTLSSNLVVYEGTGSESGLMLKTEVLDPNDSSKTSTVLEEIEFLKPDHVRWTTWEVKGEERVEIVSVDYYRS